MPVSKASQVRNLIQTTQLDNKAIAEQVGTSAHYVMMIRKRGDSQTDAVTTRATAKAERKKKFLEYIVQCHGIVSDAAKMTGVAPDRPYIWMAEDPDFKKKVQEAKEISIDFVESSLFRQIQAGVPASTIFFLKTRAKHRGYVERSEVTGADGGALDIRVIVPRQISQRIEPSDDDIVVTNEPEEDTILLPLTEDPTP